MDKTKIANMIGAGSMVALMLTLALVFGGGWGSQDVAANSSAPAVQPAMVVPASNSPDLAQQNQQLQEALVVMQEREAVYQTQIEEAKTCWPWLLVFLWNIPL